MAVHRAADRTTDIEDPSGVPVRSVRPHPTSCAAKSARNASEPTSVHDAKYRQNSGAQERTRTFTAVKPLAPEASASTNSATWAWRRLLRTGRALVKPANAISKTIFSPRPDATARLCSVKANGLYSGRVIARAADPAVDGHLPLERQESTPMASNLDTLVTVFGGSG